jgi:hypothetical protein
MFDRRRDLELLMRTLTRLAPGRVPLSVEEALELAEEFAELKARVRIRLQIGTSSPVRVAAPAGGSRAIHRQSPGTWPDGSIR